MAVDIQKVPEIVVPRKCKEATPDWIDNSNEFSVEGIDIISHQDTNRYHYRNPQEADTYKVYGKRNFLAPVAFIVIKSNEVDDETDSYYEGETSTFPELTDKEDEVKEAFLRGIQPINRQHKVLFTQKVEIKTSELKRRRPNIVINPILLEDDE